MNTIAHANTDPTLWERLLKALSELLLTCSPFGVLIFVLWANGFGHTLLSRPDLAFLLAVLFMDGALRVHGSRRLTAGEKSALFCVGVVGAVLCTASATNTLLSELGDSSAMQKLAITVKLGWFNVYAFIPAVVYSIIARTQGS